MRRLQFPAKPLSDLTTRQIRSADPRDQIRDHAFRLGFDAVGFCQASLGQEVRERLIKFLQANHYGDMGWLADRSEQRSHPQSLWPNARTVIAVGLSYAPNDDPLAVTTQRSNGAVSVYARIRDYHGLVKGKLKHLAQFLVSRFSCEVKVFVDTAPVMEKPLAQRGGLGWQGKHTNLVSRSHGSWLLLGEIYTTMDLDPDEATADRCGSCSRCLDVCPTDAFPAPYQLDATRCISYLTIEHKGPIPHEFRKAIGNRIYGCDDCLAVCPWNKFAQPTSHEQLVGRDALAAPRVAHLSALDDGKFRKCFLDHPLLAAA
jgi:epoxyqueuosine reductase